MDIRPLTSSLSVLSSRALADLPAPKSYFQSMKDPKVMLLLATAGCALAAFVVTWKRLQALQQRCQYLEAQFNPVAQERDQLQEQVNTMAAGNERLRQILIKQDLIAPQHNINEAIDTVENLKIMAEHQKAAFDKEVANYKELYDQQNSRYQPLLKERDKLAQENTALQESLTQLRKKLEELEKANKFLEIGKQTSSKSLEKQHKTIETLTKENRALQVEIRELKKQIKGNQ